WSTCPSPWPWMLAAPAPTSPARPSGRNASPAARRWRFPSSRPELGGNCCAPGRPPASPRCPARAGDGLDDGLPLLLRPDPVRPPAGRLLPRPALDAPAHGHRQPLPALRRLRPSARRAGLAALLEALAADRRLRTGGHGRVDVDVPAQLHQLRRAARHGGDV